MEPPIISKFENITETITFVVTGKNVTLKTLKETSREVENDLRRIDGISQVETTGFPDEEIEIAVNEQQLKAYNLSFRQVSNAVANANLLTTGGAIKTEAEEYLIRANNRAYYADELDNIVVRADATGNVIRLKDIAEIRDQWNETPNRSFFNGDMAIRMQVSNTNSEDLLSQAENDQ